MLLRYRHALTSAAVTAAVLLAGAGTAMATQVGTPTLVGKSNMFTADRTVNLLDGDLGALTNFGLVGFASVSLNAHTNSNLATPRAHVNAAFGNHANGVGQPEVSYLETVDGNLNVSLPANSRIVFGPTVTIGQTDNGNSWTVNGNKLEMQTGGSLSKADRVLQDSKTTAYLDLDTLEQDMGSLSNRYAKAKTANAAYDFSDQNRRHIDAEGDTAWLNLNAAQLQGNRVTATLGKTTRLIVNVDAQGADSITLPQLDVDGINHAEYAHWTDFGVVYNLVDSKASDGLYHGKVGTAGASSSVILAPQADVDASQNVEGQIIARNVTIGGEFHRNSAAYTTKTDTTPSKPSEGEYVTLQGVGKKAIPFDAPKPTTDKPGYTFAGWTTGKDGTGTVYKPGDTVDKVPDGGTLYPQWKKTDTVKHTLHYDVNGGSTKYGDETLPAVISTRTPERDGYKFTGWTIDGKKVGAGETVSDNGKDVTVTAHWEKVEQGGSSYPTKPSQPDNGGTTETPSKPNEGNGTTDKPDESKPSEGNTTEKPDESKPSEGDDTTVKPSKDVDTTETAAEDDGLAHTGVSVIGAGLVCLAALIGAVGLAFAHRRRD